MYKRQDGRNIFWALKVVNSESPDETSISFSPLILILTGPEGDNFSFTNSKIKINENIRLEWHQNHQHFFDSSGVSID